MPTKLLKQCVDEVLRIFTAIVNKSLTHEHFPSDLKHALIKLHLKKPSLDTNELNHYRPVSYLQFLSTIIEKIVVHEGVNPCSNMGGIILGRNIHPACGMYCATQSATPC